MEPSRQRRGRFMEDRASGRMHMIPAVLAAVGGPTSDPIMLRDLAAVFTKDAIGIEAVLEPFETGRIIGKLCLKGF